MNSQHEIDAACGAGLAHRVRRNLFGIAERVNNTVVQLDSSARSALRGRDEGAATAEYAVVLIAATGFAALLVALLKSDSVKTILLNLIKQALNVG